MCLEGRVSDPRNIIRLKFRQFEEQNFPEAKRRVWFVDRKYPEIPGTYISEQDKPVCTQGIKVKVNFKKDSRGVSVI